MNLPEVAKVERLSLRPGDRLVLSFDCRVSDEESDAILAEARAWGLPEGTKVIILDRGQSLQVLSRDDS